MKHYEKNRLFVWLMWLLPMICMGPLAVGIWTGIQLAKYSKEKEFYKPTPPIMGKRGDY